jgi:hypothetical protein
MQQRPIGAAYAPLTCAAVAVYSWPLLCGVPQGVQTCVGGYDLVTGVRLGRVDLRTPAVALMFSRDGSLLVVATQVRV